MPPLSRLSPPWLTLPSPSILAQPLLAMPLPPAPATTFPPLSLSPSWPPFFLPSLFLPHAILLSSPTFSSANHNFKPQRERGGESRVIDAGVGDSTAGSGHARGTGGSAVGVRVGDGGGRLERPGTGGGGVVG
ncbi:hypothetical protein U1Q18_005911 [Sarracenia purpurea var. burkii]